MVVVGPPCLPAVTLPLKYEVPARHWLGVVRGIWDLNCEVRDVQLPPIACANNTKKQKPTEERHVKCGTPQNHK